MRIETLLKKLGDIHSEASASIWEMNSGVDSDLVSVHEYWKALELSKSIQEDAKKIRKTLQDELVYSYSGNKQDSLEDYE